MTKNIASPLRIDLYTDGGCKPNPGPGGWGVVIRFISSESDHEEPKREWFLSGNDPETTNNQMELQAAISGLSALSILYEGCELNLYTDSEYLRQGVTRWMNGWEKNGWRTKGGQAVKNQARWQQLGHLVSQRQINWHWLKGHADHPHNERADQLATRARKALARRSVQHYAKTSQPELAAKTTLPNVELYIKVSYSGSRKVGGWGVVLKMGDHKRELQKQVPKISANALLIRGALEGLWALNKPCSVTVISDADYLIRGASQWIKGWLARDWHTKDGKLVANRAEWEALLAAVQSHRVTWQLGQVDEDENLARASELASQAAAA